MPKWKYTLIFFITVVKNLTSEKISTNDDEYHNVLLQRDTYICTAETYLEQPYNVNSSI